jgi:rare lipoprotein A
MHQRTVPVFNSIPISRLHYAFFRAALALILASVAYGCSTQAQNMAPTAAPMRARRRDVVLASWYGPGFEGRRTSSGERFHQNGYTAASRTLPLGSHVRVTNVSTGRSVVVRINDRGPYVKGRGLDLSHAAARKIGIDRRGVGVVRVTRIDNASDSSHYALRQDRELDHTPPIGVTPIEATTESASIVSNPIGAWFKELIPFR